MTENHCWKRPPLSYPGLQSGDYRQSASIYRASARKKVKRELMVTEIVLMVIFEERLRNCEIAYH